MGDELVDIVDDEKKLLTARAEHRLHLRADNAEARLTPAALAAGCLSLARREAATVREAQRKAARHAFEQERVGGTLAEQIRRGEPVDGLELDIPDDIIAEVIEDVRYAPYVERQQREAARLAQDDVRLPEGLSYRAVGGLSMEMIERLERARPATLAAASRIRGITPAALSAILVHGKRRAA